MLGDTTNTSRSVKRLRLKGAPENVQGGKENRPAKYLATLQDKAQGTPRRETSRYAFGFANADQRMVLRKTSAS